jgi:hypothetical protein
MICNNYLILLKITLNNKIYKYVLVSIEIPHDLYGISKFIIKYDTKVIYNIIYKICQAHIYVKNATIKHYILVM